MITDTRTCSILSSSSTFLISVSLGRMEACSLPQSSSSREKSSSSFMRRIWREGELRARDSREGRMVNSRREGRSRVRRKAGIL